MCVECGFTGEQEGWIGYCQYQLDEHYCLLDIISEV